ncbi:MAG: DUF1015 domain-containing protein, partial [Chloroflexi bacterium]|nr:DUF1015 domain-containing protein [Chloroflexota bacterium]
MAEVRPFRGLRYTDKAAASLTDLICPPYDVISPAQGQELEARSPYNAVHLEMPRGEGDAQYANAARLLAEWRGQGILARDETPSYYFMRHTFSRGNQKLARWGLMAAVRLESYDRRVVLPHEETRAQAREDRFRLMMASSANFSPIMSLYRDPQHRLRQAIEGIGWKTPTARAVYGGDQELSLWAVGVSVLDSAVQAVLKDAPLFIADGHHRYETALRYRDEQRQRRGRWSEADAFNYVMMTLIDFDDPGLVVLPYHRALQGMTPPTLTAVRNKLLEVFQLAVIDPQPKTPQALEEVVRRHRSVCLGLLGPDGEGPYLLTLRPGVRDGLRSLPGGAALRDCEGWVLHQAVLGPILGSPETPQVAYLHDPQEAWDNVLQGKLQMAFYLKPFPLDLFQAVVSAGQKLPPKST